MSFTLNAESSVVEFVLHSHEVHQQNCIFKQIYTINKIVVRKTELL